MQVPVDFMVRAEINENKKYGIHSRAGKAPRDQAVRRQGLARFQERPGNNRRGQDQPPGGKPGLKVQVA